MPTPFMHLHFAERLLAHPALDEAVRQQLCANWPAFYLGSVAPDFQVVCAVVREATHFYTIPVTADDTAAFDRLLTTYPALASPNQLPAPQAIFWAAYGAHLLYDLLWDHAVLTPHFRHGEWGDKRGRFLAHNTLLTYMDTAAVAALPPTAAATLRQNNSQGWMPFDPDDKLAEWQELLAVQLLPSAPIRTIEIYAQRMGISPAQFAAQLNDPTWMAEQVFCHISLAEVQTAVDTALAQSIPLITHYLCGEQRGRGANDK
ncbi:MAG: zinc dependent phospholipase C family protein [Chloroflexi bacterium]|nr:zinc dependent phospholipase C family protein [Chloroflexota bacterium]